MGQPHRADRHHLLHADRHRQHPALRAAGHAAARETARRRRSAALAATPGRQFRRGLRQAHGRGALHRPRRPAPHVLRTAGRPPHPRRPEIPRCGTPRRRLVCRARCRPGTVSRRLRRRPFHQRFRHRAERPGAARNIRSERERTLSRCSHPRGASLRLLRLHPSAVGECARPTERPRTTRLAAEPNRALLRTRRKHGDRRPRAVPSCLRAIADSTPDWRQ